MLCQVAVPGMPYGNEIVWKTLMKAGEAYVCLVLFQPDVDPFLFVVSLNQHGHHPPLVKICLLTVVHGTQIGGGSYLRNEVASKFISGFLQSIHFFIRYTRGKSVWIFTV